MGTRRDNCLRMASNAPPVSPKSVNRRGTETLDPRRKSSAAKTAAGRRFLREQHEIRAAGLGGPWFLDGHGQMIKLNDVPAEANGPWFMMPGYVMVKETKGATAEQLEGPWVLGADGKLSSSGSNQVVTAATSSIPEPTAQPLAQQTAVASAVAP